MSELAWLGETLEFPDTATALTDPNGLLAVGGDLSVTRLLCAYRQGIFPWYSEGQPILWWSPSPRTILIPEALHLGRSNRKLFNKASFTVKVNTAFRQVIEHCAETPRADQDGTWIIPEMIEAYCDLHEAGHAHSIESWQNGQLVGGLYGVSVGKAFFGESMFSLCSGASKFAFMSLVKRLQKWDFQLIDCQIYTEYLASFGAHEVSRDEFERRLSDAVSSTDNIQWAQNWAHPPITDHE